jgi:hypothetical protein
MNNYFCYIITLGNTKTEKEDIFYKWQRRKQKYHRKATDGWKTYIYYCG